HCVGDDTHFLRMKRERVDDVATGGLGDREYEIGTTNGQPNFRFPEEPTLPGREEQMRHSAIDHIVFCDDDASWCSNRKVCVVGGEIENVELMPPRGDSVTHTPEIAERATTVSRCGPGGGGTGLYDDAGRAMLGRKVSCVASGGGVEKDDVLVLFVDL